MKLLLFYLTFFFSNYCLSQNLQKLDENNGFRQYKLGSLYNPAYGAKTNFIDGVERVIVKNTIEYISDIPVESIELFYTKDTLSQIILRFKRENGYKLKDACESAFGKPTKDESNTEVTRMFDKKQEKDLTFGDNYHLIWQAKSFKLSYHFYLPQGWLDTSNNCHLVYKSNDYEKRAQRAKKKYTSNDF